MIVLGLHFGHDASISIIRDGEVLLCVERERITRVKHALSLTASDIEICLSDAGVTLDEIDYCGITSTQAVEYVFLDPASLSITLGRHSDDLLPSVMMDKLSVSPDDMSRMASGILESTFESEERHTYKQFFPDGFDFNLPENSFFGGFEHFIQSPIWEKKISSEEISTTSYSHFLKCDDTRHGFHYPATLHLVDKKIPAAIFSHHYAHAAYAFYESPFDEAAILTHDGGGIGGQYGCGIYAYGCKERMYPLTPHHLAVGELYDFSAVRLGFDLNGGAGKLMGLAAYGEPVFFDQNFVGNWHDTGRKSAQDWIEHCEQRAKELGYDLNQFGDPAHILAPVNVDFAASCQKITEEVMLTGTATLAKALAASEIQTKNLCLSGGVALNCPANARIISESGFSKVSILPAVIDSGLSIGSALAIYYNLLNHPRKERATTSPTQGYLGLSGSHTTDIIEQALNDFGDQLRLTRLVNSAKKIAQYLNDDKLIALFYGRSEIGPRALGHRSILANPQIKNNWARVNNVKKREHWRPFAPAVLDKFVSDYFSVSEAESYFMLVNATVLKASIPAVTHVDGSARVQSVTKDCGLFYDVLSEFHELSGIPVVLNTSFNGPGEPVIETPEEAIRFFLASELDALFFDGYLLRRKVDDFSSKSF